MDTKALKEPFFTKDSIFYKTLFRLLVVVAMQNLVAYSVNMLDNIMLGSYNQNALSGAATVNQIFFMVQQTAIAVGNALVAVASQYWGRKELEPIRRVTGIALKISLGIGALVLGLCSFFPRQILGIFTTSPEILAESMDYLVLLKWSFVLFLISNLLISMLRSVEIVKISFLVSLLSLAVNGCINYTLIFGHFGFPEMGVRGAAVGTLTARIVELAVVLFYVAVVDKRVCLFKRGPRVHDDRLFGTFIRVLAPILFTSFVWAVSVPMQTAVLGHLSSDAIAANSVATTFFQYLKVIVVALSSASAVIIGKDIGAGEKERIRSDARTLAVVDIAVGVVLALLLFLLKDPLLSLYELNDNALALAHNLMIVMSVIMVGMSYQMPVAMGILQGAGDTRFTMWCNILFTWGIVMPLTFLTAFFWRLPVEIVVIAVQSDQILKCLPVFLRFRSYRWIHRLTASE